MSANNASDGGETVVQYYAGKKVLLTGSTGFLGKVILEKLLWECGGPGGASVQLLIRPTATMHASGRLKELLRSEVFDRLRQRHGDEFEALIMKSVSVVEGDVAFDNLGLSVDAFAALVRSVDVILHSAALVKWASPLDALMKSNSLGSQNIAHLVLAGHKAGRPISLVQVSTAWVHGRDKKGQCAEQLGKLPAPASGGSNSSRSFSPTHEVEVCLHRADEVKAESLLPNRIEEFLKKAKERLGPQAPECKLKEMASGFQRRWVEDEMTRWGEARAQSYGWNDCYTFSKAIAEYLVASTLRDVPFAIVRPSGVVAASSEPATGWIDAYLLVEPLIEGVGRGQITAFPGNPRCVIDCVPVDFVCNVIITAAAKRQTSSESKDAVSVYQCASGDIYPNNLGNIERAWMEYFKQDPMLKANGQPPKLKPIQYHEDLNGFDRGIRWKYVAPLSAAARALEMLPGWENSDKVRAARGWLVKNRRIAEKVLDLARLYSCYTLNEWVFETHQTRALMADLSDEDKARFPYFGIPTNGSKQLPSWDWAKFWKEVHIPGMRCWVLNERPPPRFAKL